MFKIFLFLLLFVSFDEVFGLPNDIEKCRINDEKCLVRSANNILRKYYGGITEIDLVSLDPFNVDKIKINHDYGAVKANGTVYNIKLNGFATTTIQRIFGFDQNLLQIYFKTPKFSFSGFFKAKSELLGFTFNNGGSFLMNFYDFEGKLTIKLEKYSRYGKTYFKTNGYDISSTVRTGELHSSPLSGVMQFLVNASFDIVLKASIKSYVGDLWTVYYEKAINRVLTKVPIEDLFLI